MNYGYILGIVGRDSFIKGRWYDSREIRRDDLTKLANSFMHTYRVKSEISRKLYTVKVKNNGKEIEGYSCSCPQFERAKTCKHIAAVLINCYDTISSYEFIDKLALSKEILASYKNTDLNTIKEKLDIELEFQFRYGDIYLKVKIGNKKKYTLSTYGKASNFIDAYNERKEYVFGKNLIYSPSKYYFDNKDAELLEYLGDLVGQRNSYYYVSSGYISINIKAFETILSIIGEKEFTIIGSGKIYNVYNGLPTEYNLSKDSDGNFVLKLDDVENYKFLDYDYKFAAYNHNLYILDRKDRDLLKQLRQRKIDELVFDKNSIKEFSNGLLNNVKNNITIDNNVTEIE